MVVGLAAVTGSSVSEEDGEKDGIGWRMEDGGETQMGVGPAGQSMRRSQGEKEKTKGRRTIGRSTQVR